MKRIKSVFIVVLCFIILCPSISYAGDNNIIYEERVLNEERSIISYQKLLQYIYETDDLTNLDYYEYKDDTISLIEQNYNNDLYKIYGGAYIEKDGSLVVNITNLSAETIAHIKKIAENENIIIKNVKFSLFELQKIYVDLCKLINDAPYFSVTLMEKENNVTVAAPSEEECASYIKQLDIYKQAIIIDECENSFIDCAVVRAGNGCTCLETDKIGSIGFPVKRASSNGQTIKGIVTAAHVVRSSDGSTLGKKVSISNKILGSVVSSRYGNTVDAAFVQVKNGILPPWWTLQPKLSNGDNINGWGNASLTPVGSTIWKYGGTSGISSGIIVSNSATFTDSSSGYTFYTLTETTATAYNGDSGGPCVKKSSNENIIVGLMKGKDYTTNHMYYCKVNYVLSELTVTLITA